MRATSHRDMGMTGTEQTTADLKEMLGEDSVRTDEPMKLHTTFRVGGPADFFVTPTIEQLPQVMVYAKQRDIPFTVIGNGSNLLVSDLGLRGIVAEIGKKASRIVIDKAGKKMILSAQSGVMLGTLAKEAEKLSLTGLEFAAGIPGTVGGAVVMNAGAYGGEIASVLQSAMLLLSDGTIHEYTASQLELSYRRSIVTSLNAVVLSAKFILSHGDTNAIQEKMHEYTRSRKEKQPLEYPSAGSTFKRPEGYFAGKLIMDAGLAGFQVGGARVSEKHCGFVINTGDATANDIALLMREVTARVYEYSGVKLEPEVKILGRFDAE